MNYRVLIFFLLIYTTAKSQVNYKSYDSLTEMNETTLAGNPAYSFELESFEKGLISLDEFKGKVVILNFWHLRCGSCWAEIPSLNMLVKKYKDDLVIISITRDNIEDLNKALIPVEEGYKIKNENLSVKYINYVIIPEAQDLIEKYKVSYYPINFIIDQEGVLVKSLRFVRTWSNDTNSFEDNQFLDDQISALLK